MLQLIGIAAWSGATSRRALAAALTPDRLLAFQALGNVTLLHLTDTHATLLPVYYREPDTLIEVGEWKNTPPYVTGQAFLNAYGFEHKSLEAYAYTHLDFAELASRYGKMGGYSLLYACKADQDRACGQNAAARWRGYTARLSHLAVEPGLDMLEVTNQLGVEVFAPHWGFTYGIERVESSLETGKRVAFSRGILLRTMLRISPGDHPATPYFTPTRSRRSVASRSASSVRPSRIRQYRIPSALCPTSPLGSRKTACRSWSTSSEIKKGRPGRCFESQRALRRPQARPESAGHRCYPRRTYPRYVPKPVLIDKTIVINSGAHGKFLSRLDLDVRSGKVVDYRYKLIPVLSGFLPEDPEMAALIKNIRTPYESKLAEKLAISESLLYRRGNFNGTFDELILDALMQHYDARLLAGLPLWHHASPWPGDYFGGRLQSHEPYLPSYLGKGDDRPGGQDGHGGRGGQSFS